MRVRVRLFATYREIVGAGQMSWTSEEGETLGGLLESLFAKYPRLAGHRETMMLAVNQAFVEPERVLHDGDEVALLPPVSGGAS